MPNAAFVVAAQQRLALSFPRPMRCNCDLTKLVHDAQHAHVCPFIRKNAGYLRHQMVLSGLREACNECAAPNTIRDHSLKRAQNEREIQPDLFVHKGNASFMIDVSVVHPAADSYARGASRVATYAARLRENDKTRKYKALADRNGFTFVPFVRLARWEPKRCVFFRCFLKMLITQPHFFVMPSDVLRLRCSVVIFEWCARAFRICVIVICRFICHKFCAG